MFQFAGPVWKYCSLGSLHSLFSQSLEDKMPKLAGDFFQGSSTGL